MLNTIPMGGNPFDFILGGGGIPGVTPVTETGAFGRILSLLPQNLLEDGKTAFFDIGSSRQSPQPAGQEFSSLGMIPIQLPLEMAMGLGIDMSAMPIAPELSGTMQDDPTTAILTGELLRGKGADDDKLYLKVIADPTAINAEGGNQSDGTILLPVELRTVEQNGNRLIADGFLHQAAGKELPIRVRWELAGSMAGISGASSSAEALSLAEMAPNAPHALPRLLEQLGVSMMVIETSQKPSSIDPALFLPGSALMPSNGIVSDTAKQCIDQGRTKAPAIDHDIAGIAEIRARFDADMSEFQNDDAGLNSSKDSGGIPSMTSRIAPESQFAALNGPSQDIAGAEKANQPNAVRFFDLDQRLGQLKRSPGQTIRIQLVPAQLGKMELSIAHNRGLVTVNLAVESEQARRAVEANLAQLESHLTSSGIRVDQFQVSISQPGRQSFFAFTEQAYRGQFGHRQNQRQWQGNNPGRLMNRFAPPEQGFETMMINCLA